MTAVSRTQALPTARPRLLVIDDDKLLRMTICWVADRLGYVPAGAASYDEAARLLQDGSFDCITLDLSIGAFGGCDMLGHLASISCKAPIIVVSGSDGATCSETIAAARALHLDIRDTIAKPVDLAVLRLWLERFKSERAAPAAAVAAA